MSEDRENKGKREAGEEPAAEEFLKVFRRGVQFTEELLRENERLRVRLVRLEEEHRVLAQKRLGPDNYRQLLDQLQELDEQRNQLLERFRAVESENRDYLKRYEEMEQEYNRLANLYIASYQLHSSLDLREVVRVTFEIIVNLIGGEVFCLYVLDGNRLLPVRGEKCVIEQLSPLTMGRGVAGKAAQDGTPYVDSGNLAKAEGDKPRVCIPLAVAGETLGVICIFKFLEHKPCVTELDRELFGLLGLHSATAMAAARLHAEAGKIPHDAEGFRRMLASD